jgi:RNA polymerase sigma-70 factor, ECF subfamily
MEETRVPRRSTGIDARVELGNELVELLPRLRRYARTLARNVHDADDLVQLSLERALSHASQMHAGASLGAWVFGILRNAWIDEQRARMRRARVFAPAELGTDVAQGGAQVHVEDLAVHEALARLPEEQRSAVALVMIEGLSYKEAAHVMAVPVGTLTSRLARAREALQTLLAET